MHARVGGGIEPLSNVRFFFSIGHLGSHAARVASSHLRFCGQSGRRLWFPKMIANPITGRVQASMMARSYFDRGGPSDPAD
jgi:hypothetical protein